MERGRLIGGRLIEVALYSNPGGQLSCTLLVVIWFLVQSLRDDIFSLVLFIKPLFSLL